MAQKKIDKTFLISDDSLNVYGFRLLSSGFQADRYARNPIGFRQHKRDGGVVVRWEDLTVADGKITAKPVINLSNPEGQRTYDEVENGFLNAASVGKIVVLAISESPDLMLDGQTGPTITKWYCKEISLVDLPGNENATAEPIQLFDESDNEINLTDFVQATLKKLPLENFTHNNLQNFTKNTTMKKVITKLNLSDDATEETVLAAVQDLSDKLSTAQEAVKEKNLELAHANKKADDAEKALTDFKTATAQTEVVSVLDSALTEGKITKELSDTLAEDYKGNPEALKKVLAALPQYKSLADALDGKKAEGTASKYVGKTILELQASNQLESFMTELPDLYDKYKGDVKSVIQ